MAIGSLLSALGIAAVKAEAKATARRVGRRMALGGATLVLLILAFGFGLAAFTVWLAGQVGTIWALVIVAAGALVLAGAVQTVAALTDGSRRRRPPPPPPVFAAAAGEESGEAPPPAGSVLGSLAVVGLVGFILAQKLFKR